MPRVAAADGPGDYVSTMSVAEHHAGADTRPDPHLRAGADTRQPVYEQTGHLRRRLTNTRHPLLASEFVAPGDRKAPGSYQ